MTGHTRKWKEAQLKDIQELAEKYPVIAVASIKNFPGALAKELRKKLQGKAVIKVSKTRIIKKALENSKKDTKALDEHLNESIAVIFTEMNPFEVYAFLKKNKVNMPAKPGQLAPDDLVVPAGDTGIPPGPALSDLKAAGLKTVVQGPTISIAEDKVVTKKGETITDAVAGTLSKLDIKPIKVGLKVTSALEKSQLFLASVLDIDIDKVKADFSSAARNAFLLAIETGYFTKETAQALIAKGFRNAKALALEANLITSATVSEILAKGRLQATALKAKVPETLPQEPKPEEKAEAETKPAEKGSEQAGQEKPAGQDSQKQESEKEGEKNEPKQKAEEKKE
jgi:large subunit ribosomal protein L10